MRIVLADDHPIIRNGVRTLLERDHGLKVVAEAASADELHRVLDAAPCDLIITDFNMPGGRMSDGLSLLGMLRRKWPALPVIVLTIVSNPGVLRSILSTGARGLVNKTEALDELPQAVQAVAQGRNYVGAAMERALLQESEGDKEKIALSIREVEVFRLFASGLTVSQIARQLNRSVKTVSRQKVDAMAKLGIENDIDLYSYAREHGLL
ncbi:response regulator [Lysobacter sp. TAF61]|uniref:response regulator n=1 Tax=Lysobacter sp. TAF61 TaxID=3233072 RepID=UPI003F9C9796